MKTLKARKLNLFDAFRLASILAKYIDTKDIDDDPLEFISRLINRLTPQDYLHCVNVVAGTDEEEIKAYPSIEILTVFIEGLKENQIVSLVSFYKSLVGI